MQAGDRDGGLDYGDGGFGGKRQMRGGRKRKGGGGLMGFLGL